MSLNFEIKDLPNGSREISYLGYTFRPIKGMEGPMIFRTDSGEDIVLHYDPSEGEYYDQSTDMYVTREDL